MRNKELIVKLAATSVALSILLSGCGATKPVQTVAPVTTVATTSASVPETSEIETKEEETKEEETENLTRDESIAEETSEENEQETKESEEATEVVIPDETTVEERTQETVVETTPAPETTQYVEPTTIYVEPTTQYVEPTTVYVEPTTTYVESVTEMTSLQFAYYEASMFSDKTFKAWWLGFDGTTGMRDIYREEMTDAEFAEFDAYATNRINAYNASIQQQETQAPQTTQSAEGYFDRAAAEDIFNRINVEREKAGLSALPWDESLYAGACIRAKEGYSLHSHTRPDGSEYKTAYGIDNCGEILAWGYDEAGAVNGWMNSEGHRAWVLLDMDKTCAAGVYVAPDGTRIHMAAFSY